MLVILLLTVLAFYALDQGRRSLISSVGSGSVHVAEFIASALDRTVYLKHHELRLLGQEMFVQTELAISNAQFEAMADPEGYIDAVDTEWSSTPIDEITPIMQEIMEGNLSLGVSYRLHEHYIKEHGIDIYGNIFVTNKYGAVIGMYARTIDYRQTDDSWWQAALEDGYYFGEIEYDAATAVSGVSICCKLETSAGSFAGMISGHLNIVSAADEAIFLGRPYATTEVRIVTDSGHLVFSDGAFHMLEDVSEEDYFVKATASSGYFTINEAGRSRLVSYSDSIGYLKYDGGEWKVFVSHDSEELLAPVGVLSERITLMTAIGAVAAFALAYSFSRSISNPIRALAKTANEFSRGKLRARTNLRRADEIGQLADSFNNMAEELSELYDGLEAKVQERTKEVIMASKKLSLLGSITRHDAINQLTILKGWLSVAGKSVHDEEQLTALNKAREAIENLHSNLEFTATYEKVGVERADWIRLDDDAMSESLLGIDLKGIKIRNDLAGLQVYGDPMFPKVLRNLVDNSIEHGGGVKEITLTYREIPGGLLVIYQDDGIGISTENKKDIFDKEVHPGQKKYGLYLSKEILSITDITIRETGTPGQGVRFEMLVPRGKYRITGGHT